MINMTTQDLTTEDISHTYRNFQDALRGFINRRVNNPTITDDILQDIFVKLISTLKSGRRLDNVPAWLYSVSRTTIIDHFRSDHRFESSNDEDWVADESEPSVIEELGACLEPFINQLPTLYKEALQASELKGERMRLIAQRQGVSVSAVKSRVSRGRKMLHQRLLDCLSV